MFITIFPGPKRSDSVDTRGTLSLASGIPLLPRELSHFPFPRAVNVRLPDHPINSIHRGSCCFSVVSPITDVEVSSRETLSIINFISNYPKTGRRQSISSECKKGPYSYMYNLRAKV